ncbi:hypothetical protein KUCAC02_009475 [Chaenocephalus aceratus]|uniref:Uncharacterized protein n=1 Tax=Chaenocephalus aceratus TaxID=36190 RepID=A0ACB9WTZ6_CHAAC|nr:hypothetical protein KUCAC02_009475 [Chaenocephalus aceratus]
MSSCVKLTPDQSPSPGPSDPPPPNHLFIPLSSSLSPPLAPHPLLSLRGQVGRRWPRAMTSKHFGLRQMHS